MRARSGEDGADAVDSGRVVAGLMNAALSAHRHQAGSTGADT
jgi:hypothetical protein